MTTKWASSVESQWSGCCLNPIRKIRRMDFRGVKSVGVQLRLTAATMLAGCTSLRPRHAPPQKVEARVHIPRIPRIQAWKDESSPVFQQDLIDFIRRQEERTDLLIQGRRYRQHPGHVLVPEKQGRGAPRNPHRRFVRFRGADGPSRFGSRSLITARRTTGRASSRLTATC